MNFEKSQEDANFEENLRSFGHVEEALKEFFEELGYNIDFGIIGRYLVFMSNGYTIHKVNLEKSLAANWTKLVDAALEHYIRSTTVFITDEGLNQRILDRYVEVLNKWDDNIDVRPASLDEKSVHYYHGGNLIATFSIRGVPNKVMNRVTDLVLDRQKRFKEGLEQELEKLLPNEKYAILPHDRTSKFVTVAIFGIKQTHTIYDSPMLVAKKIKERLSEDNLFKNKKLFDHALPEIENFFKQLLGNDVIEFRYNWNGINYPYYVDSEYIPANVRQIVVVGHGKVIYHIDLTVYSTSSEHIEKIWERYCEELLLKSGVRIHEHIHYLYRIEISHEQLCGTMPNVSLNWSFSNDGKYVQLRTLRGDEETHVCSFYIYDNMADNMKLLRDNLQKLCKLNQEWESVDVATKAMAVIGDYDLRFFHEGKYMKVLLAGQWLCEYTLDATPSQIVRLIIDKIEKLSN